MKIIPFTPKRPANIPENAVFVEASPSFLSTIRMIEIKRGLPEGFYGNKCWHWTPNDNPK